jgi:acyl transferase domain-containing protein
LKFVIDSAASFGLKKPEAALEAAALSPKPRKSLLLFSANHEESLKRVAENTTAYVNNHPDRVEHAAYTLAERREHMKLRSFGVFSGPNEPFEVSARVKYQGPSQVAFVFTGQGAQWYVIS